MSLKNNIDFLGRLRQLQGLNRAWQASAAQAASDSRLVETHDFGPNPGGLRMFSFLPEGLTGKIPLVVVLHGCTQNAAAYEIGAGWCTLAQRYGFALLLPEQTRANNPNLCFNWFVPDDVRRDSGEAASIRQMIEHVARTHPVDRARIFVTGLSAGGAMAAAMLATYPDVFAGGAVIAGIPYGVAGSVRTALREMRHASPRSGRQLGSLVRAASAHTGPWPKLSVWHGSGDRTVDPANADALVRQWLDLHGLPEAPMAQGVVDGQSRQAWFNSSGETAVESYTIAGMAHGTPLGTGPHDERFGAAGPFMLEAGISSSYHIAKFFGLTGRVYQRRAEPTSVQSFGQAPADATNPARAFEADNRAAFEAERSQRRSIDVGGVIARALSAAGLIK